MVQEVSLLLYRITFFLIRWILSSNSKLAEQDGGDIEFIKFEEGVVFLRLQGACSGCPSAPATLKGGIERVLMHWVPEVQGVIGVEGDEVAAFPFFSYIRIR